MFAKFRRCDVGQRTPDPKPFVQPSKGACDVDIEMLRGSFVLPVAFNSADRGDTEIFGGVLSRS